MDTSKLIQIKLNEIKTLLDKHNLSKAKCNGLLPTFNNNYLEVQEFKNKTILDFITLLENNSEKISRIFFKFSNLDSFGNSQALEGFTDLDCVYLGFDYFSAYSGTTTNYGNWWHTTTEILPAFRYCKYKELSIRQIKVINYVKL